MKGVLFKIIFSNLQFHATRLVTVIVIVNKKCYGFEYCSYECFSMTLLTTKLNEITWPSSWPVFAYLACSILTIILTLILNKLLLYKYLVVVLLVCMCILSVNLIVLYVYNNLIKYLFLSWHFTYFSV